MTGSAAAPDVQFILAKDDDGDFCLWGCRGEGRGCSRNRYRARAKPCDDCVLAIESETIAEFQARMKRGDA